MKDLGTKSWILFIGFIGVILFFGFSRDGKSEPSWARKYKSDCTLCHTIYPRLNRTGYVFKRLGYRFPAEVERRKGNVSTTSALLEPSHRPAPPQESHYVPALWGDDAAAGKALVVKFSCATCHQIEGVGGRIGPSLDGVGARRSSPFIRDHITNPQQHAEQYTPELRLGGELMPRVPASPQEIAQMTAYVLTLAYRPLAGGPPHPFSSEQQTSNPAFVPADTTPASEEGNKLYFSAGCAACHSISGQGGDVGPGLDGVGARRSPVWLMRHITNPQKHVETQPQAHDSTTSMMPPTELSTVEIAKITDFLLTLPPTQQQQETSIPRNRLQDYFGVAYLPAVEMERSARESNNIFQRRELNLYAAGTLGGNFSFFVQPIPAVKADTFLGRFEMIQGIFNYGSSTNFLQVRFGQIFNLQNTGFAGTDRNITETTPLVFRSTNGFNPAELGRGVSLEYTTKGLTTFKAFAAYQTPPEFQSEGEPSSEGGRFLEARRSRTYGFALEKVIGSKGLSGIQVQYAGGYTPVLVEGQFLSPLRFQRLSVYANKTFQNKRNVERLNLISGVTLLRDNRLLGLEDPKRSRGYGFFLEANWIPVRRLGLVARFDQLRATTRLSDNTVRAGMVAVVCDFTKYTRMLLEYQRQERSTPTNLYRVGWQFNF